MAQPRVENRWEFLCGRFQEYYPPVFDGGLDPFRAEQWMGMISSILDSMGLVGHDRVACATFVLRDDARMWWEVVSQTQDTVVMNWKEFRQLFNEKYYCDVAKTAKMNEFLNLVQGNATITEYVNKFDGLAKFAFDMVPTDVARKERFIKGLNPRIVQGIRVAPVHEVSTYAQVVGNALAVESA